MQSDNYFGLTTDLQRGNLLIASCSDGLPLTDQGLGGVIGGRGRGRLEGGGVLNLCVPAEPTPLIDCQQTTEREKPTERGLMQQQHMLCHGLPIYFTTI